MNMGKNSRSEKEDLIIHSENWGKGMRSLIEFMDLNRYGFCIAIQQEAFVKIVYVNQLLCEMTKLSREDFLHMDREELKKHIRNRDIMALSSYMRNDGHREGIFFWNFEFRNEPLLININSRIRRCYTGEENAENNNPLYFFMFNINKSKWDNYYYGDKYSGWDKWSVKRIQSTEEDRSILKQEAEYRRFFALSEEFQKDGTCYVWLNLTHNWCGDMSHCKYLAGEIAYIHRADDFFDRLGKHQCSQESSGISNQAGTQQLPHRFNCANLMQAYYEGKTKIAFEQYFRIKENQYEWLSTVIQIMRNPHTGDLEAIIYSKSIQQKKMTQMSLVSIVEQRFLYVFCLDLKNGTGFYYGDDPKQISCRKIEYDQDFIASLTEGIIYPEAYEFSESISLDSLKQKMPDEDSKYNKVYKIRTSSGQILIRKVSFVYMNYEKQLIIVTCSDITDEVKKNYDNSITLKKAYDELKHANQSKNEFLTRMSHDIRTPMNGIIGLSTLTLNRTDLPEEVRQNLLDIQKSGQYLLSLVNDSLDISKMQNHKLKVQLSPHHILDVIDSVITCIKPMSHEKEIELKLSASLKEDDLVLMDAIRIQQIFINLLSNAIKYTQEYGQIIFSIGCNGETGNFKHYCFSVKDNGIGMSKEFLPKLFTPFEQEDRYQTQNVKGTGLGMSIVKYMVDLMQGKIDVHSELGKGTEIKVYLDLERYEQKDDRVEEKQYDYLKFINKNVLLCEDNKLNAKIATCILKEKGMNVVHAENGKKAVQIFLESIPGHFALILMDVRMPVMNGLNATRLIRSADRSDALTVPVIAMTANAYEEDIKNCLTAGMNDHIAKPMDIQKFYYIVNQYIKS